MSSPAELHTIPRGHLEFRATIRQIAPERIAPRAAEIEAKIQRPGIARALR